MTTGEIVGIVVGVAGLGVGAYVLLRPPTAPMGQSVQGYQPPPPKAPPSSGSPAQGVVGDVFGTVGDVVQGVTSVINLFEDLFGGM